MRFWLRSLAVIAIGAAGGLTGLPAAGHGAPAMAVPGQSSPSETRIRYQEGHYPELFLPDGRHEVVRSLLNITKPMHLGVFVWDEYHIP